ncbi:hypothetical protein BGW80DRAFT_1371816 [Lactifluus volemus]|nr:hypothetical protein BGW80DRAFT_1371816 [Lactifluus volemus]
MFNLQRAPPGNFINSDRNDKSSSHGRNDIQRNERIATGCVGQPLGALVLTGVPHPRVQWIGHI